MLILGIETSCDETAAALVQNGHQVRSNIVASQIEVHRKYGGTVPELASRHHLEAILPVLQEALEQAGATFTDINGVAVTNGPGLVGSLLVGVCAAKALALAHDLPLVGVNHLEAHIYAGLLAKPVPLPALILIVSGGHAHLVQMRGHGLYRVIGHTRDDAPGEAFDKAARLLNLGYPGGPIIDQLARQGNAQAVKFPRAHLPGSWDFSFSGLKTALYRQVETAAQRGEQLPVADVAASFQEAVVEVLVEKSIRAAEQYEAETVLLTGGVAANSRLRSLMEERTGAAGLSLVVPPPELCTDNAAMVACAGYYRMLDKRISDLSLDCYANLPLEERGAADLPRV